MKVKLISIVMVISLIFGVSACGNNTAEAENTATEEKILGQDVEEGFKYTLYIGLNDKDTFEQVMSTEDALEEANLIVAEYAGGYTQMIARGGWTNDDGTMGHENTLVYIIYDVEEESLKAMLDELINKFNQSSILVEKNSISHIYYSGNENA